MAADASDIAKFAASCQKSIVEIRKHVPRISSLGDWLDIQGARLRLWIETLGVYAGGKLSVVHRLADNQSTTYSIVALLDALDYNFEVLQWAVLEKTPPTPAGYQSDDYSSDEDEGSDGDRCAKIISRQQRTIGERLARLEYIAVRLRREGIKKSATRAATAARYEPPGDEGKQLVKDFEEFIGSTLRHAFDDRPQTTSADAMAAAQLSGHDPLEPGSEQYRMPEYLRTRLKSTMLERWRRISYERHHAAGLAQTEKPAVVVPALPNATSQPEHTKFEPKAARTETPTVDQEGDRQIPPSKTIETAATEIPADYVVPRESDVLSRPPGTTVTSVQAGTLSYPIPPKLIGNEPYFSCPTCGQLQSTALLDKNHKHRWPKHVMDDLAPYICIFERCSDAGKSYQTSSAWSQHCQDVHSRDVWSCPGCPPHERIVYEIADEYKQHLESQHPEYTADRVRLLVNFGSQQVLPEMTYCLLCGFEPETGHEVLDDDELQEAIMDHIAKQHMQPLALASLPWDIPGAEDGSADQLLDEKQIESAEARESIIHDENLVLEANLDEREAKRLADDPSLARFLQSNVPEDNEELKKLKDNEFEKRIRSLDSEFAEVGAVARLQADVEPWLLEVGVDRSPDASGVPEVPTFGDSAEGITSADKEFQEIIGWISPRQTFSERDLIIQEPLNVPSMCDWILEYAFYPLWKTEGQQQAWLVGRPTLEKAILFSTVVDDIAQYCRRTANIGQATFRFSSSDPSRRSFEDLLRFMIAQLGRQQPGLMALREAYRQSEQNTLEDSQLRPILFMIAASYSRIFLHVDGLDAFPVPTGNLAETLREFKGLLQAMPNLHLMASIRNAEGIPVSGERGDHDPHIWMVDLYGNLTVKHFISRHIKQSSRLSQLPERFKTLIEDTLAETSERR
jgi:hypothetical protein